MQDNKVVRLFRAQHNKSPWLKIEPAIEETSKRLIKRKRPTNTNKRWFDAECIRILDSRTENKVRYVELPLRG